MGVKNTSKSLCWSCTKACNHGCSWSESFTPVEGWDAEFDINCNGVESYVVNACPEFIRETPENKNRDLDEDGCIRLVERLMEITHDDYKKSKPGGLTEKEIERFIRGRGASRIHGIANPEAVIKMLRDSRTEYRKKKAQQSLVT